MSPMRKNALFSYKNLMGRKFTLTLAASLLTGVLIDPFSDLHARAGRGGSMGSRGLRTYTAPPPTRTTPGGANPFTRSITPPPPQFSREPQRPMTPPPAMGQRAPFSPIRSHPFASGFLGGLLGAGLFGMLSGHGLFGGFSGIGSLFGILIQLVLIYFVIRWLYHMFSNRKTSTQPTQSSSPLTQRPTGPFSGSSPTSNAFSPPPSAADGSSVTLLREDYIAFQQLLLNIQAAWSQQNLTALQRFATPEMVSYFNDQLTELSSQGARNVISDVRFEQGDLSEAWNEDGRQYATVSMKYSMIDVTTDSTGRVIEGSPDQRVAVTEIWTFVRATQGGYWLLAAIQQAR